MGAVGLATLARAGKAVLVWHSQPDQSSFAVGQSPVLFLMGHFVLGNLSVDTSVCQILFGIFLWDTVISCLGDIT
jgi:hypothetical protein